MKFYELAQLFSKLENTSKRLEMIDILSIFFKEIKLKNDYDELDKIIYLLQGQLVSNIKQFPKMGIAEKLVCMEQDVFRALPRLQEQGRFFDIIMIAPPQYKGLIDRTLSAIVESDILSSSAMILCQHDTSETPELSFSGFSVEQQRKYGNTTFTVLRSLSEGK